MLNRNSTWVLCSLAVASAVGCSDEEVGPASLSDTGADDGGPGATGPTNTQGSTSQPGEGDADARSGTGTGTAAESSSGNAAPPCADAEQGDRKSIV
jgi:hypothetical protein